MPPFFRSLKFRLALAFVLWSALLNAGLMAALAAARERAAVRLIDQRLGALAEKIGGAINRPGAAPDAGGVASLAESLAATDEWFVIARGPGGVTGEAASNMAGVERADLERTLGQDRRFAARSEEEAAAPHRARTLPLLAGGPAAVDTGPPQPAPPRRVRAARFAVEDPDGEVSELVVGISVDPLDAVAADVLRVMVMAAAASMLAAAGAGWLVAGGLAGRLEKITRTVAEITPRALERGVKLEEGPDELGQMGAGLNKMLEGLHRAFRGQERFISDVSHELKTPLAALLTEAQVLHAMGATTEDYKAFVASAEDEARRLGKLVESFLMLARFQHGKRFIADTLVSINDVVLESMKHSQMIAEQQRVGLLLTAFDAGEECNEGEVRGDPDLLRVAFDNVIRNAVQFSKAGSAVRIEVTCVEGRMMVSIRDQGPGIPPEHRDRIFNRFEQAPTRESGKRGTGLGLAIAKGVIDLHGGTISVDNHPEGGCVFRIGLAMPGPAAAGPGNPGPSGVRTVPGRAG